MSLGKKTFEACLKSHTFKVSMNSWDSPCWKNEGSLYTFYVQFILISFLGWLFNLQSREKKKRLTFKLTWYFHAALFLLIGKSCMFTIERADLTGMRFYNILRAKDCSKSTECPPFLFHCGNIGRQKITREWSSGAVRHLLMCFNILRPSIL